MLTRIDTLPEPLRKKLELLERILRSYRKVIIAYSGGVDSTFLAAFAGMVLKENALAVTADSESIAPEELQDARNFAARFGFQHLVIKTHEMENPAYRANTINRCYYCKQELMQRLMPIARAHEIEYIALGAIMDDLNDLRPGEQAALEQGAVFPMREATLTKHEIRMASRALTLPTADKPGSACLASRIPFGQAVNSEKLDRVARAEALLKQLGFYACRVRHHDNTARIEIPADQFAALLPHAQRIVSEFKRFGFIYIALDLQGFRSGSLHEAL